MRGCDFHHLNKMNNTLGGGSPDHTLRMMQFLYIYIYISYPPVVCPLGMDGAVLEE